MTRTLQAGHRDRTFSSNGTEIEFGSPYGSSSNDNHEGRVSDRDLKNSITYVEGERVSRDRHGNTVVDRSHIPNLPDSHPIKEVHGRHGTVYHYRDGRRVHVDNEGFVSTEEFDPQSGSMVNRIIGTPRHRFNPLI